MDESSCPLILRMRLEEELEQLTGEGDTESERVQDIYERLDELDASTAETKAARILHGLGHEHVMKYNTCMCSPL